MTGKNSERDKTPIFVESLFGKNLSFTAANEHNPLRFGWSPNNLAAGPKKPGYII